MLNIPELILVTLHIVRGCLDVINFQDGQTELLGGTGGGVANGTSSLLYVANDCTSAVCSQVIRACDALYSASQHIFLEGGTSAGTGRTANNDNR